jgi:hypothetical protein
MTTSKASDLVLLFLPLPSLVLLVESNLPRVLFSQTRAIV